MGKVFALCEDAEAQRGEDKKLHPVGLRFRIEPQPSYCEVLILNNAAWGPTLFLITY